MGKTGMTPYYFLYLAVALLFLLWMALVVVTVTAGQYRRDKKSRQLFHDEKMFFHNIYRSEDIVYMMLGRSDRRLMFLSENACRIWGISEEQIRTDIEVLEKLTTKDYRREFMEKWKSWDEKGEIKQIFTLDNPNFVSDDGVLYRRTEDGGLLLHRMPAAKTEVRQWPADLRAVGENAFSYSVLEKAELPDTVTTLEDMAVNDSFVGNIVLPESVKSIGSFAFGFHAPPEGQEASSHTITVMSQVPPQITTTTFYYMDYNLEKKLGDPVTEIIVPDSEEDKIYETYLEVWGAALDKRYGGGTALRILKTENGAQIRYEFYEKDGKTGYKKIGQELPPVLSDSLGRYRTDEDGRLILIQCTSTASVVDLSSSEIVSIDEGAFDGCRSMTAVRLPETLETMPEEVFACNTNLKVIIAYGLTPPAAKPGAPQSCALFVRPEALNSYETAWGGQMRKVLGTSQSYTVTSSGLVFDRSSTRLLDIPADMSGLTIPSYVTAVYDRAAAGNPVLSRITVPAKVTEVGEGAFADCTGLTSVSWATEGAVPDSCFEGCVRLKTFGATGQGHRLTSIGNRAFYGCRELQTVLYYSYTENNGTYYYYYFLEYIGEEAFYGCGSMTYAYLHDSVTHVGAEAFKDSGLTQVFWYTKTAVPDGCFEYCQDLTSLGWGDGGLMTAAVGDRSFYGCAGLKSLLLPSMLETVGGMAFDGRGGSPLTLTFAAEIPPVWDGPESTDELVIYVPDSKDDGDRIYLDYADAWAHWLGQEPGRILKTKDGAQDRVFPGAATPDDAVRKKTQPEVTDRMQPAGTRPEEEAPGETAPEETQPEAGKPGSQMRPLRRKHSREPGYGAPPPRVMRCADRRNGRFRSTDSGQRERRRTEEYDHQTV